MCSSGFDPDLGARISRPHDQDSTLLQLGSVSILMRVHLNNPVIEVAGERGDAWFLVIRHGDNDVFASNRSLPATRIKASPSFQRRSTLTLFRTGRWKR